MEIISMKFTDDTKTRVNVVLNGGQVFTTSWPCTTWHAPRLLRWLAEEGEIQDADPPPPPVDLSDVDNLEKGLKALGLVVAQWNGKTPAQLKSAFKAAWDTLSQ